MSTTLTAHGPTITAGGRLLKLVEMKYGTAVLTEHGPVLIKDMIIAHFVISELIEHANIEKIEDNKTRFTFDAGPEVYDILAGWGAETENDEESDPPEVDPDEESDERDLPKTLPPITVEPNDGSRPAFPPIPSSVFPAAVSALVAERLAKYRDPIAPDIRHGPLLDAYFGRR